MIVLLAGACAGAGEDSGAAPESEDTAFVAVALDPEWDPDALGAALEGVTALQVIAAGDVAAAYLDLMALGDVDCPGSPDQLLGADLRGCTADSGVRYAGVATWSQFGMGWLLSGDFEIVDAEGGRFVGGGAVSANVSADGTGPWEIRMQGVWAWEGQDGWLGEGTSSYWVQEGAEFPGKSWMELDGGVTYGGVSLWFEALRLEDGVVTGELRARDPSGGWYTLAYRDGECAALDWEGEARGELCFDPTAWMGALADARFGAAR